MNNDNVIPIGVNIYKRQIAEKKSKTKPPIKPKFKIVLTEEEKKAKEEKIKAKNKMAEEDMLSFFEGKKSLKMNEFIQGQIKDRNVDNTIRIFLFSITYDPNGMKLIMSDTEYINSIQFFIKREKSEIISKVFNDIIKTLEIKYIKILVIEYLNQTNKDFINFYKIFINQYKKNPEKFKREINIKEFIIELKKYLDYNEDVNFNELSLNESFISHLYKELFCSIIVINL